MFVDKHVDSEEEVDEEDKDDGDESSGSEDSSTPGAGDNKKEVFKKPTIPASKIVPASLQGQIIRTREGVILPSRNAFEFVHKPENSFKDNGRKGGKQGSESGKALFQKNLLKLKRQNTSQLSANKFMSIVKYEN